MEALAAENERLTAALASRDSFLTVAAHELRNPMTPILGRVTLLRRAVLRGELSNEDIAQGLEKLEQLVNTFIRRATTLLDVSRASSDRWIVSEETVDVCGLVADMVERYRLPAAHAGAGLELHACCVDEVFVVGDRIALEQILENLLSNAIKYGAGSPIRITVSIATDPRVTLISVEDGGPGIPAEDHQRIFERFERAVSPDEAIAGYGIGLWVVRNLCEAMGGTIEVRSSPGKGSAFRVTLPLMEGGQGT